MVDFGGTGSWMTIRWVLDMILESRLVLALTSAQLFVIGVLFM